MLPAAARGFLTGPVVQGPGIDWQKPASRVIRPPRFLAAQRSAVSSRREEIAFVALAAQHNTRVCGPLCEPRGSSWQLLSCRALLHFLPALSFWIAAAIRYAIRSTIRLPSSELTVFRRRKAFLLCKNPCGGTARAKKFPEEICFAPRRVFQICRTPD